MKTHKLGNLGETKVALEFLKNGFEVYQSVGEGSKFDLVVHKDDILKSVQVKTSRYFREPSNAWQFTLCRNNSFDNSGIDILALYVEPEDKVVYYDCSKVTNTSKIYVSPKKLSRGDYCEDFNGLLTYTPKDYSLKSSP